METHSLVVIPMQIPSRSGFAFDFDLVGDVETGQHKAARIDGFYFPPMSPPIGELGVA